MTAPSPPIFPQTREDKKKSIVVCNLTLRLALASAIGHRHTHTPNHRRAPCPLPELSGGLTAGTPSSCPPPAFREPLPYSHLDTLACLSLGLSRWPKKLYFPFPGLTYRYRPLQLQSPNKGPFVTIFAPGLLTQFLAFSWPSATQDSPSKKVIKNYPNPHLGRPPKRQGGSSLPGRV